jgi:hypothetical protein
MRKILLGLILALIAASLIACDGDGGKIITPKPPRTTSARRDSRGERSRPRIWYPT